VADECSAQDGDRLGLRERSPLKALRFQFVR
jgi:hypothetical protein